MDRVGPDARAGSPDARPDPRPELDVAAELDAAAAQAADGVIDSAKRMLDEGGDAARAAFDTAAALKRLAGAEIALAKAAIVRATVMLVGATVVALVGVVFVFATLSAGLVALGLGWTAALGISTALLLLLAGLLAWRGAAMFRLARFDATRRQLAVLRGRIR